MSLVIGCRETRRSHMRLSRKLIALFAVVAISVPAVAFATDPPPPPTPTPAQAFGVICQRPPTSAQPGTEAFRNCVVAFAKGVRGAVTADDAARVICRQATPPLPGDRFGACVSSTKTLVLGLRALRAQ
jgi:hypothetical protein